MKLAISDVWKWAAKDKDGGWTFFERIPEIDGSEWVSLGYGFLEIDGVISDFPDCDWQDSLHQIVNGELVKHIELKVDDKVMVREFKSDEWRKRYFSHFNSAGRIVCFGDGSTSWTANDEYHLSVWYEWRLPTQEELG